MERHVTRPVFNLVITLFGGGPCGSWVGLWGPESGEDFPSRSLYLSRSQRQAFPPGSSSSRPNAPPKVIVTSLSSSTWGSKPHFQSAGLPVTREVFKSAVPPSSSPDQQTPRAQGPGSALGGCCPGGREGAGAGRQIALLGLNPSNAPLLFWTPYAES